MQQRNRKSQQPAHPVKNIQHLLLQPNHTQSQQLRRRPNNLKRRHRPQRKQSHPKLSNKFLPNSSPLRKITVDQRVQIPVTKTVPMVLTFARDLDQSGSHCQSICRNRGLAVNEPIDAVATTTMTTEAGIRSGLLHHGRAEFEPAEAEDHHRRTAAVVAVEFPGVDQSVGEVRFEVVTFPAVPDMGIGEHPTPDNR